MQTKPKQAKVDEVQESDPVSKGKRNDINQLKTELKQKRPKQSASWGIKQRKQCKQTNMVEKKKK